MQQLTRDVPAQFRQTVLPFLAESVLILSRTRAVDSGQVPELIEISRCCATHALSVASKVKNSSHAPQSGPVDPSLQTRSRPNDLSFVIPCTVHADAFPPCHPMQVSRTHGRMNSA